jgi:hypothetical protein
MKKSFYIKWVLALTLGELVGFLSPTLVGAVGYLIVREGTVVGTILILLLAAIGGLGEGAALGFAQSVVLRPRISSLSRRNWVLYTAMAAAIAWILGMGLSVLGDPSRLHPLVVVGYFLIAGPVFLLSIGFAQWLELKKHVVKAWKWIIANAIAWPIGVMIPVITIGLVPDKSPVWVFIIAAMTGGVIMGVVVGMITGRFLVRMMHQQDI